MREPIAKVFMSDRDAFVRAHGRLMTEVELQQKANRRKKSKLAGLRLEKARLRAALWGLCEATQRQLQVSKAESLLVRTRRNKAMKILNEHRKNPLK